MKLEQKLDSIDVSQSTTQNGETEKPRRRIEPYTDAYRDAVIKFYEKIAEEYPEKHSANPDDYVPKLSPEDPNSNFWVSLNEGNEVDGTISLKDCKEGVGYVSKFYVEKGKRGGLIGGRLVHEMMDFMKGRGYKKFFGVTMPDNKEAQEIYKKHGMTQGNSSPTKAMSFLQGTVYFEMDLDEQEEK